LPFELQRIIETFIA